LNHSSRFTRVAVSGRRNLYHWRRCSCSRVEDSANETGDREARRIGTLQHEAAELMHKLRRDDASPREYYAESLASCSIESRALPRVTAASTQTPWTRKLQRKPSSLILIRATGFAVYSSKTTSGNIAEHTTAGKNLSGKPARCTGAD